MSPPPAKSTAADSSNAPKPSRTGSGKPKSAQCVVEKVRTLGLHKEEGFVYFVDRRGDLLRMKRGVAKAVCEVIVEKAIRREKGYMYYLDDDGDLVREPDSSRDG